MTVRTIISEEQYGIVRNTALKIKDVQLFTT
jgi:hypothetical protein